MLPTNKGQRWVLEWAATLTQLSKKHTRTYKQVDESLQVLKIF